MDAITQFLDNYNWLNLLFIPGLLIGFAVHELGHALVAYYLGDRSQVHHRRITPNIFRHISWLGTTLFLLFGIGWPKALQFDPEHFKHRYLDSFLVAMAGPVSNLLVSSGMFIFCLSLFGLLTLSGNLGGDSFLELMFFTHSSTLSNTSFSDGMQYPSTWMLALSNRIWVVNFLLAMVSLVPLPPFDGFTALSSLMGLMRERRLKDMDDEVDAPDTSASPAAATPTSSDAEELDSAAGRKRQIAQIHFQVGTDYHQDQRFDDAIARYRQALEIDPSFGPAYVNLGLVYKARQQRSEAIQALRGATMYAADEKSRAQAWTELHALSSLPTVPETEIDDAPPQPEAHHPWTSTHPSPDWLTLTLGTVFLAMMFGCAFIVFLITLMRTGL